MFNSNTRLRVPCAGLATGLAAAILIAAAPASAQNRVDADFAKYCRTKFPNSTPTIRRGVDHYCNRGGSLQGVDLAEACRLTTGSRRYERMGARVLCVKTPAGAPTPAARTDADFAKYCRARYPNSVYRRLPTRWGVKHVCRQTNAHGFTNQDIDLARACRLTTGSRHYTVSGARVLCQRTAQPATASRRAAGEPDFAKYCRIKYPNSAYRRLRTRSGANHVCRQVNASGFTNQGIDLAEACRITYGTRRYFVSGTRVLCAPGAATPKRSVPRHTRRNAADTCRRICGGQPTPGARAYCYQHAVVCQRR